MYSVLRNNEKPISPERVGLFCLFVTFSYTSMEPTMLPCSFSWVWSGMPKVVQNSKLPISLERVEWFCRFFASSYLHVVRYPLKLQNTLFGVGIVRHGLSTIQIARFFKLKNLKAI